MQTFIKCYLWKGIFENRWYRITIDTDIFYNIQNNLLKKKDLNVIVELKASKNKNIDDLFEQFPFQEIRFSKYCNGIEIFNKN